VERHSSAQPLRQVIMRTALSATAARVLRYAFFGALVLWGSASARPDSSPTSTTFDEAAILKAFKPTKLVRHDVGDRAGALYCPLGACDDLPVVPGEEVFNTYHKLRLGARAPALDLECSGASDLVCMAYRPEVPAEMRNSEKAVYSGMFDLSVAPGDGCLYTVEANNADHVTRRKHCWHDGKLVEQRQPLSYVGFKSVANKELKLYAAPDARKLVHRIAKGRFVEILVASVEYAGWSRSKWLLVRDEFGLVGWVSVASLGGDNACLSGRPLGIKGFCMTGD
jgi:hypothetical protein